MSMFVILDKRTVVMQSEKRVVTRFLSSRRSIMERRDFFILKEQYDNDNFFVFAIAKW